MLENHFFRGKLIAQYEFEFPFCAPNSVNEWEYIYEVPEVGEEVVEDMVESGEKIYSDTYFLVGDDVILHSKSDFKIIN